MNQLVRPLLLIALFAFELILASIAFDTRDLKDKGLIVEIAGRLAPRGLRFLAVMVATLMILGFPRWKPLAQRFQSELAATPVKWRWLGLHAVAACLTLPLSAALFWSRPQDALLPWLLAGLILLAGIAACAAATALVPIGILSLCARSLGTGWLLAALIAGAATLGGTLAQDLWLPTASLTFRIVQLILQPFLPRVISEPASLSIGSEKFQVVIETACSGYEGVGLVLIFCAGWLWYFRHEYRFPAALVFLPASAALIFFLNSFRIAMLILIGHAGAPNVAMGGFHSQAGWIAFILVAVGICFLSMRMPAFSTTAGGALQQQPAEHNEVAAYLVPFMAILASSMVSKAASGGFEWLYPLRIVAAAAALWFFRRDYSYVRWRFGPASVLIGVAVFGLWIAFSRSADVGMSPELAAMPVWLRALWVLVRIAGAVVTVPIAEELAFRGFLMRRLSDADFTRVPWVTFSWLPVLLSSLAFGVMHGERWVEGTIAGVLYAWAVSRSGRLGDAIAAHATTNALLAAWVLIGGKWQYW